MMLHLVSIYRKLPIKPFQRIFKKLYQKYRFINRNRTVIAVRDGIKYRLELNELMDSSIYYNGCFEPMTVTIINKFIKKSMIVFDIGANMGCHTLRFAKLVGKNGKVIAFEPMSWAFSKLKRNIELNEGLNDFNNIVLEKIAFSNINQGKQSICFQSSWPLLWSSDESLPSSSEKEFVEIITLDKYVRTNKINRIDFIKLDVDGYEYKIIQGGVNTIKKFKPTMIVEFGEYSLKNFGDNLESLIDLLASLGYSFYSEKNLEKYNNKESILNAIPSRSTINVLCKCEA